MPWFQSRAMSATSDEAESLSPSGPYRAYKQFGLVLLCAMWVLLGLVGHDPWKTEDATSFGVVWDMLHAHNYLAPTLAGQPYVDRPPLVFILGTFFAQLFTPWLEVHDAARLCVALLLAITLLMIALAARELAGRTMRWVPVLLFIGCVGLWDRSHQLAPEIGLLAGLAVAQYGSALSIRRNVAGGVIIGAGAGLAFLSHGFLGPIWIVATLLLLPLLFAAWRTRAYAVAALAAVTTGGIISGTWPVALAWLAPAHLEAWWRNQSLETYFAPIAGGWNDPWFVIKNLPWFTWPASPLVVWTLWTRGRGFNGGFRSISLQVPLALTIAVLTGLLLMPDPRAIHLMMIIVPLSVLGALEVDTLKRGYSGALDWFGILTFGLLGALAWWTWWDAYLNGMPTAVARAFRDASAGYQPSFHWRAVAVCVFLTILWLVLVRPARRSNRRAVLNWAAGTTLLWAMFTTIWLPYLDSRRTYRVVVEAAAQHIPHTGCVASRNLGEPQRALFYYFAGIVTQREEDHPDNACRTLIVQYGAQDQQSAPVGWIPIWHGQRRGDETERYVIYERAQADTPATEPQQQPAARSAT
ncbi:MAG TPA: hypothetical protein VFC24_00100 [Casimicrobiaceae bacterium]|nr:hypothetical protein [Casimicrobiaceae bacterium]